MTKRKNKGQSTVEYLIVVALLIAAALIFMVKGGLFQGALNNTLNMSLDHMTEMANAIFK